MKLFKNLFMSVITLLLISSLLTFGFIPIANASTINIDRLYGQDAYQTAAAIENYLNPGAVDSVVLRL